MKSRITVIVVSLFAIALVGIVGCGKKEEGVPGQKTEAVKSSGKMNDEMYVEITAQITYLSAKYAAMGENATYAKQLRTSAKIGEEMGNIFKKFGVTDSELDAYAKKVKEDPAHEMLLMKRMIKRIEELQTAGQ